MGSRNVARQRPSIKSNKSDIIDVTQRYSYYYSQKIGLIKRTILVNDFYKENWKKNPKEFL